MSTDHTTRGRPARLALALAAMASVLGAVLFLALPGRPGPIRRASTAGARSSSGPSMGVIGASSDRVDRACGGCHPTPSPENFPRADWRREVERGVRFLERDGTRISRAESEAIVKSYESRAPEAIEPLIPMPALASTPWRFEPTPLGGAPPGRSPDISNVRFARLGSDSGPPELLACEMMNGRLLAYRTDDPSAAPRVLAEGLLNPSHAEVVDLDRDGYRDVVVACLGSFMPTDERFGEVVWVRGSAGGTFEAIPLATELGRVTDAQAADLDGDGDLDLIVAVFGWIGAGEILMLEQRAGPDGRPTFVPRQVDPRHGAIHVPVVDLDRDGDLDFVGLLAQEHESVVAFLNDGLGHFRARILFAAPHPSFGSSGLQLADLDGDGDLDALVSSGDVMDAPLIRPEHGVLWLENRGEGPFSPHRILSMAGTHRALAVDLDGDGDLDVAAASLLPESDHGEARRGRHLDALVVLEQLTPGRFVRHVLESVACDHATLDADDFDRDGRVDLAVGNFREFGRGQAVASDTPSVVLWRNAGRDLGR